MISLAAAVGLTDAIRAAGADPDRVLRSVGVDRSVLSRPDGFIPWFAFSQILEEAARATGDDCFGLHFGEHYQPKHIGPLVYVALNSPTMAAAFDNIARYLRVHNEAGEISFAIEGQWAYLRFFLRDVLVESVRQQTEYGMAVALNTLRLMAGTLWAPVEVQFAHPAPPTTLEHVRVFRAPVSFGHPVNAFVIERALVDRAVPAADEQLYPIIRQYLDRMLKEMPREDPELAAVRRAVGEAIREGDPKLANVARQAAMSARTLQRRLKDHGVDFKKLVDDTRRRSSLGYLEDRTNTTAEIAYLLGYSEVSAFNRAFKRWTGSTPSSYRRHATSRSRGR
jgi:AraC-like DNA-binding protein